MSDTIVSLVPVPAGWRACYACLPEAGIDLDNLPDQDYLVAECPVPCFALMEDVDGYRYVHPIAEVDDGYWGPADDMGGFLGSLAPGADITDAMRADAARYYMGHKERGAA